MAPSSAEVLDRGMSCLIDGLGVIEAERFVSTLLRERFDYTEWHHERFDGMTLDELHDEAVAYTKANPPEVGRKLKRAWSHASKSSENPAPT